ncbi:hypothetical protein MASR2M16_11020 [Thauera terpenica]
MRALSALSWAALLVSAALAVPGDSVNNTAMERASKGAGRAEWRVERDMRTGFRRRFAWRVE